MFATSNKCIASSNKCLTINNKKLVETINVIRMYGFVCRSCLSIWQVIATRLEAIAIRLEVF